MSRLRGRTSLITGGGRGIGKAVALAFAREGADVAVGSRTLEDVRAVAEESRRCGVRSLALQLDVADPDSCAAAVTHCLDAWGRIDVVVSNAGIAISSKFTEIPDELWQRTLAVNLSGAFYVTRAALPAMLDRRSGRVIAISSIAGKIGAPYIVPYTASKHGLIGLMRALTAEYPKSGITFNSVCPAYVDTPLTDATVDNIVTRTGRTEDEARRALFTPQGRLIETDEVAAVCVLLASDDGRSINGQAINVDGGMVPW